jgi:hypothetical protein
MIEKFSYLIILFLCSVIYIYPFGKKETEAQKRKELEQYPIIVSPISFPGSTAYDFTYVNPETIIITGSRQLFEVNSTTNTWKEIKIPESWAEKRFEGFREMQFDRTANSIHMLFRTRNTSNKIEQTYYILNLEDYSWEVIDYISSDISGYWYDSENCLIYVFHRIPYGETSNSIGSYIATYDFTKKKVISQDELRDMGNAYCIYGNSPRLLSSKKSENMEWSRHFIIYDIALKRRIDFPESLILDNNKNVIKLMYYVPLSKEACFLGVDISRSNNSSIALLDLNNNTLETVALETFPYTIYNFKKIAEGKYGFMVRTRTRSGAHGQSFLCFLDYP